jgi:cysteine synthase A
VLITTRLQHPRIARTTTLAERLALLQWIAAAATGKVRQLADSEPGAPTVLVAIVGRAMAARPADRYADASEFAPNRGPPHARVPSTNPGADHSRKPVSTSLPMKGRLFHPWRYIPPIVAFSWYLGEALMNSELQSRIVTLGGALRKTPTVPLSMSGINLFAKLEFCNPVGSIKDRPAYWMLRAAIERGELHERSTVVESSSGNLALALAVFCRHLGLRFIPVIDPNISRLSETALRGATADVVKVDQRDDTGNFLKTRLAKVRELCASIPQTFWTNQYGNPDGMRAHYLMTGGEIRDDFSRLDYVFLGVSSAGTISGVSHRLKEEFPGVTIIAVDVEGSVIFGGPPKKRFIPGIGASVAPPLLAHAAIDDLVMVSETETVEGCHELFRQHGIFAGGSTGSVYAAIKKRARALRAKAQPNVLFLCYDRGTAYLDTVYDPAWVSWLRGLDAPFEASAGSAPPALRVASTS